MTDALSNGRGHAFVTGAGAITPLGVGTENFWDASLHGKSGIGEITLFDTSPFPMHIAGECSDFDPLDFISKKDARRMDRYAQFGFATGLEAAENARVIETTRKSRAGSHSNGQRHRRDLDVGAGVPGITR